MAEAIVNHDCGDRWMAVFRQVRDDIRTKIPFTLEQYEKGVTPNQ